jgi:hypothetical protein
MPPEGIDSLNADSLNGAVTDGKDQRAPRAEHHAAGAHRLQSTQETIDETVQQHAR